MRDEIIEIITRTSTDFNQRRVHINSVGEDCQISLRRTPIGGGDFGLEEVIFTGPNFSREKFERTGGAESERTLRLAHTPAQLMEKLVEAEVPQTTATTAAHVALARDLARYLHRNQLYGNHHKVPYTEHLERVGRVLTLFGFAEEHDPDLHAARWLHDACEDQAFPIDLVEALFGPVVRDLVWRVTDEPGKNRRERHAATYPKLRANRRAVILKLADRIANVVNSIENADPQLDMYRKEYPKFKEALYAPSDGQAIALMWAELDALLGDRP